MKKAITLLVSTILLQYWAHAATIIISVQNFQFTPNQVNANVGDVIRWEWIGGNHTTTSATIPAGAAGWDQALNTVTKVFEYTLTVPGSYSYVCTPHSPEMSGSITVSGTLPLKFGDLLITATNDNKAKLAWQSFNEDGIDHYVVKRSSDLRNYAEAGRLEAKGSGNINYDFIDQNTGTSNRYLYYYVEAVERNGRTTLSPIKVFRNTIAPVQLIANIGPNPVSKAGHLMLQFNAEKPGRMLVRVLQPNGSILTQTEMEAVQGLNNGHLHLSNGVLAAGKYTVVCTLDGITETREIIVQ